MQRRQFLGLMLSAALPVMVPAAPGRRVEVRMKMSPDGTQVYFDPIGLHLQPGDTVRWIQEANFHSVTAYHPANSNHELRIPEQAKPWDSGILLAAYPAAGSTFEWTFTVEGVYDYFCRPHEAAGMVGRLIVGHPGDGPGSRPFNYAPEQHWNPVPVAAQRMFPAIEAIMQQDVVRVTPANQSGS
jgi:plastocyanin